MAIDYNRSLAMDIGQGMSLLLGIPKLSYWKTSDRPKNAKQGTLGFNTQTNSVEYYNGSYWLATKLTKV